MASNQSNALVPIFKKNSSQGQNLVSEQVDERILRILGLEDAFDIDYDTYITLLREKVAASRMTGKTLPTEEVEMITDEFKRVRSNKGKGRFKINKKKITADSFKKGTSADGMRITKSSRILPGGKKLALPPGKDPGQRSDIEEIKSALVQIVEILKQQSKFLQKASDQARKDRERLRRGEAEKELESGLSTAFKVAEKILAPVKSALSRIIDFFTAIFIGRAVLKLIDWFSDPSNQQKIRSISRFLKDNWPKLLALYLRFGTGLGRFVGKLTAFLFKAGIKLAAAAASLLAKAGIKKFGAVSRFLGGKGGKALAFGLQAATTVGTTMALGSGIENFASGESTPAMPGFSGGGSVNMNKLLKSMSGLMGMYNGKNEETSGFVSGEKGVDKVPAMLSDGEFVMSRGAVQKYGVQTLESMNAAGGGTNQPRMMGGKAFAAGGGYIGKDEPPKTGLRPDSLGYSGGLIGDRKDQLSQDNLSARLKRIEQQIQSQNAISSGKGVNIRGAQLGSDIGKGFGTTFMGREAIKVSLPPGGSYENEIIMGGKRYFAMKKGNDVIYVSNFAKGISGQVDKYGARNKSYSGMGGSVSSGLSDSDKKNLPKKKIMMGPDGPFVGYLRMRNGQPEYARPQQRQKGFLEQLTNLFDPSGAKGREETLNARSLRLTAIGDLQDYRRRGMSEDSIKKMLNDRLGPSGYSRAVNDLKARESSSQSASIKPSPKPAQIAKSSPNIKPPAAPTNKPVKVTYASSSGRRGAAPAASPRTGVPKTPSFGAVCKASDRPRTRKILGIF